jgi:hypothetical protein
VQHDNMNAVLQRPSRWGKRLILAGPEGFEEAPYSKSVTRQPWGFVCSQFVKNKTPKGLACRIVTLDDPLNEFLRDKGWLGPWKFKSPASFPSPEEKCRASNEQRVEASYHR